jgi:hypothetical protein
MPSLFHSRSGQILSRVLARRVQCSTTQAQAKIKLAPKAEADHHD